MKLKRAIWISILLYISTFLVGILTALALGTDLSGEQQITTTHWIISIIGSIILATLFSLWYFKKAKTGTKEGLHLGLTFLAVGIIGDLLFILPYILGGIGDINALMQYYQEPLFYISVILIVVTPIVIGKIKSK